jgi:hypothetical protein
VASGEFDQVIAHTLPGPNASTGVLVSLGFEHVADQEDTARRSGGYHAQADGGVRPQQHMGGWRLLGEPARLRHIEP